MVGGGVWSPECPKGRVGAHRGRRGGHEAPLGCGQFAPIARLGLVIVMRVGGAEVELVRTVNQYRSLLPN